MPLERSARPLARCLQCTRHKRIPPSTRHFSTTPSRPEEVSTEPPSTTEAPPTPPPEAAPTAELLNPAQLKAEHIKAERINVSRNRVSTPSGEGRLMRKHNVMPVGSRRRRAALQSSANIPFHMLPYQCFQEARSVLQEDRKEKVTEIDGLRRKILRLSAEDVPPEKEARREERLKSWRKDIERLKVLADINDPLVKKKFEDGIGDMNKPIYRHLADLKWRSHKRQILMQRITQMNVVPDVLPAVDPTVSTELSFGSKRIEHGDFVLSSLSTKTPSLDIQSYDKGSKLVSIAVVTPDVPNVEKDGFDYRCHFLASNIHISPTRTSVDLSKLSRKNQVIQSWLPPTSQKGAPYQRLSIFILEQPVTEAASSTPGKLTTLDVEAIKKDERYTKRENFILRSFVNRHNLQPIGVDLFRTQYDEDMESVMRKRGMAGWDVEFKRKRINPLPYQRLKSERYR